MPPWQMQPERGPDLMKMDVIQPFIYIREVKEVGKDRALVTVWTRGPSRGSPSLAILLIQASRRAIRGGTSTLQDTSPKACLVAPASRLLTPKSLC